MSDQGGKKGENGSWQMPEPVFRTSEGKTPKSFVDLEDDIPTDPGFKEPLEAEPATHPERPAPGEIISSHVRSSSVNLVLVFIVVALIVLAGYILWAYYLTRASSNGTF